MPLAQTGGVEVALGIGPWHLWGKCPIGFPIGFRASGMRSLPFCLGAVLSISQQVIIKSWCPLLLMIYSQGDPRALFSMRNCQTYFWSVAHLWMVTLLGGKVEQLGKAGSFPVGGGAILHWHSPGSCCWQFSICILATCCKVFTCSLLSLCTTPGNASLHAQALG